MQLSIVLFALLAVTTGCTTQRDYTELLAASLLTIERGSPIEVIVLTPSLAPEAREAAKRLRKVVEQADVKAGSDYDFPARYFLLKSITISGSNAHVVGTLGPILSGATLDCGSTFDIAFYRKGGRWQSDEMEITMC